ncbi:MAG: hypothetical protein AAFO69_17215, partial [Bacteroidota bacterium]
VNRRYTKYYYKDILVVSIDANGEIEWTGKINKNQETLNDFGIYSSYFLSVVGDQLMFMFNDDERNLVDTDNGVRTFSGSGGMLNMVVFDASGDKTRYPVYFQGTREPLVRPGVSRQVDDEVLLYASFGRKQRIGRITLVPSTADDE